MSKKEIVPQPKQTPNEEQVMEETILDQSIREMLFAFKRKGGDLEYCVREIRSDFKKAGYRSPSEIRSKLLAETYKLEDATEPKLGLPERNGHLVLAVVDDKVLTVLYDLNVASDTGYVLVNVSEGVVILNYPKPDIELLGKGERE